MKSFDTDLKKYSEKIKLKVSERRELRERILSYMEYHPLPKQESVGTTIEKGIISEKFIRVHFNSFQLRIAGGVLVLLLILVPIFAERSVPGEVLYMLKTGVNEKIQAQLANSPYEKIEFEIKLMERRIAEVRILASEGKLTEEAKDDFEETVKEHAHTVQQELTELRTQDADSAAIAEIVFNTSLEVQSTVLGTPDGAGGEELLEDIFTVVNTVRDEAAQNNKIENQPSYIGLVARVESQTTRAFELFETVKKTATEEERIDIERRLSDINRLFKEAKEKNTSDEPASVSDLAKVHGQIQKLISFMSDLDIRKTVKLESLVPVVLSDEERIDLAREELRNIGGIKIVVEKRISGMEADALVQKVGEGLEKISELLNTARTALELQDVTTAEPLLSEAEALVNDLDAMTAPISEEDDTIEESVDTPVEVDMGSTTPSEQAEEEEINNIATSTPTTTTSI